MRQANRRPYARLPASPGPQPLRAAAGRAAYANVLKWHADLPPAPPLHSAMHARCPAPVEPAPIGRRPGARAHAPCVAHTLVSTPLVSVSLPAPGPRYTPPVGARPDTPGQRVVLARFATMPPPPSVRLKALCPPAGRLKSLHDRQRLASSSLTNLAGVHHSLRHLAIYRPLPPASSPPPTQLAVHALVLTTH